MYSVYWSEMNPKQAPFSKVYFLHNLHIKMLISVGVIIQILPVGNRKNSLTTLQ